MTSSIQTQSTFRVLVTAASPAAQLAALSVASILGIGPQQAAERLASLPTVLADDVAPPVARRLAAVLSAFGLQVRLDPTLLPGGTPSGALADLAVQARSTPDEAVVQGLAGRLALPADTVRAGFNGPEGLVLRGVAAERATELEQSIRRDAALRVVISAPETACYDAFRLPGRPVPVADLMRLGLGRCRFSGAVAAGMNRTMAQHLARRSAGRLAILNRSFLRFDLCLIAAPGLDPQEVADFLVSRPGTQPAPSCGGSRPIDSDLAWPTAVQFRADYEAIGLIVGARLRGLPCQGPKNP